MPPLPPEILDSILEYLVDRPITLKTCCLISKLWVPRVQRHLFARVRLGTPRSPIKLWKKTFPDPSNSPAHHTRTLTIFGTSVITAADMGVSNWIHPFHNLIHLELSHVYRAPLFTLYGLSPTLRSLSLRCTPFDSGLICSFPLLEDLALVAAFSFIDVDRWNATLASPKLTGTLILEGRGEARSATRRLPVLSGGLHFSKISTKFCNEEAEPVTKLVSMCSKTLEKLTLFYHPSTEMPQLDLSKATKLRYLTFQWRESSVRWITMTLQTVKSRGIQHIDIYPMTIGEEVYPEWQDLDHLLVKLCTSHSIRPRVMYEAGRGGKILRDRVSSLLPELTRRGLVDLVEAGRQNSGGWV